MSPTHDQLLDQLSRLKETPLPDGFEAALHERLVRASQEAGGVVVPFRSRPRRKATLVLIAALSVPLAAAAASGVLSHYWHRTPTQNEPPAAGQAKAKAAAARRAVGRPASAPGAPSTAPESVEPTPNRAAPTEAQLAGSEPVRTKGASSGVTKPSEQTRAAVHPAPSEQNVAAEQPKGGAQPGANAQAMPGEPAPLEQLDLSWPGGNAAQRTGTNGATSSSATSSSSTSSPPVPSSGTPATSGLRRAGQDQNAGEHSRIQNREMRGRTEAGRSGAGSERAQRGGAAQQRQMNQGKRGQ
jgi:hypothetical protein